MDVKEKFIAILASLIVLGAVYGATHTMGQSLAIGRPGDRHAEDTIYAQNIKLEIYR